MDEKEIRAWTGAKEDGHKHVLGQMRSQEVDGGAATLLHEGPQRLDVVMMDAAAANAQPLALAGAHEMQRDVRVLKMIAGLHRFEIRASEDEAIRTERIAERTLGQGPAFGLAIAGNEVWARRHDPADGIADVQPGGDVAAEGTHLRGWQIVALDAERLGILLQGADGEFEIVAVRQFVVRIDEHDVIPGRVTESETFAFLHVLAGVIEHDGTVTLRDVAGRILREGVGEDDFDAVARVGLGRDGGEAIVEQRSGIERWHDDADFRIFGFGHRVARDCASGAGRGQAWKVP